MSGSELVIGTDRRLALALGLAAAGSALATPAHPAAAQPYGPNEGLETNTPGIRRVLVSERAVGTDQDKKFVMIVDAENRAAYRQVTLGVAVDGLRVVSAGLKAGERIVVNGLQRIRPGASVAPQMVPMTASVARPVQLALAADSIPE